MTSVSLLVDSNVLKESREYEDEHSRVEVTVQLDAPASGATPVRIDLGGTATPQSAPQPSAIQFTAHGKELATYPVAVGETYKGFIPTKDGFLVITEDDKSQLYRIDRVEHGSDTRDTDFAAIEFPGFVNSNSINDIVYDSVADKFYVIDKSAADATSWTLLAYDASTGAEAKHIGFNQNITTSLEMIGAVDGVVFFEEISGSGNRDLFGYSIDPNRDLTPSDPNTSNTLLVQDFFTDSMATGSNNVSVYQVGSEPIVSCIDFSQSAQNVRSYNLQGGGATTTTNNTSMLTGKLSFSEGVLYSLDSTGSLIAVSERGVPDTDTLSDLTSFPSDVSILGFDLDPNNGNQLYVKVTPSGGGSSESFVLKYITSAFNGSYSLDPNFGVEGVSFEKTSYQTPTAEVIHSSGSGSYVFGGDGAVQASTSSNSSGDYTVDNAGPITYDSSNDTYYVEVNFSDGEQSKTLEIMLPWGHGGSAGRDDLIDEGPETVILTVNSSGGFSGTGSPTTITIEDGEGIAGLTSELDTDISDGGGETNDLSPFNYRFDDKNTTNTTDDSYYLQSGELYNVRYTGTDDVSSARFTIEGIDAFASVGGIDLFVGGGHTHNFTESDGSPTTKASDTAYANGSSIQPYDFRLDLAKATQDPVTFELSYNGVNRLFQLTKSSSGDQTDSVTFTLNPLDNGGLPAGALQQFFNDKIAFTYSDLTKAQTTAHDADLGLTIELSQDGTSWNSYSNAGENKAEFRFYNEGVNAFEAVYHDEFIQVLVDGSSRNDILTNGAAEVLSEDWVEWMGHPDPSHFNVSVVVNGETDASYSVVDVLQEGSVLLIMNKSLDGADSVNVSYTPPTTSNPNNDSLKGVIQSEEGVDAGQFSLGAKKAVEGAFTADVGSGAVLGFDGREELDAYLELDWSWDQKAIITKVDGTSFSFEFLPNNNWFVNPNNDETASDLILTDGFVRQMYRVEVVDATHTHSVDDTVSMAAILGPDSKGYVTAWQEIIESRDTSTSTQVNEHVIMTYGGVGGASFPGYPLNHIPSLNFEMFEQVIAGSKYDDVIGSDFSLAPITVAAGAGNDILFGSVFTSDHLDGGAGDDTVVVYGDSSDYQYIPLNTGGYALGRKGEFSLANTSEVLDANSSISAYTITGNRDFNADWIDVGTVDTLINIEKISFKDQTVTLTPNLPAGATSISVSNDLLSMSSDGEPSIPALARSGVASEPIVMAITDLTDVAFGDLIEPATSGFDYLDLRSLSGDWYVDAATNGVMGDIADAGSVISYNAGSFGDYYDFRGFEGYIISGNSDGSEFRLETADGIDDIVVVDGGRGLFIVLDPAIATTGDVLSFRGTTEGIKMDLSAVDADGYASFDNLADASSTDDGKVFGADYLFGSEAGDDFTGYTGAGNVLAGYGGADTLTGGDLADVLVGGTGVDTLSGLAGNDVLIDLDDGTLTGGDGKDLFVVRGTNNTGDNTQVADFELGSGGPGIGGGNKTYTDRIAFNFSVASLIDTSLKDVQGDLLSNLDYKTLENLIFIDVQPNGDETKDFRIKAILRADDQIGTGKSDITLGQVDVVLDSDTRLNAETERLEHRIEDQEDFLASIKNAVRDQMLYNESALSVTGTQTNTDQLLDGTVNLFISLVREDKFAVAGGQGKPVLVALRDGDGNDVGSNFRPGKGNEVIAAGRESDKITIQRDEEMSLTDTYGRDTVIERGGDNDQIIMPLSFQDILDNDDLDLSRTQRGREGEGKTLRIEYSDSTPAADSINDVDLMVYKQYNDYSSSFRVENLTLYNDDGNGGYVETNYDLGTVTATGLETSGGKDAYLVGRENISDQMVIKLNEGEAGIDNILNIVLADVTAEDKVLIEGDGTYQSVADGTHRYEKGADGVIVKDENGNDVITTDHQVVTLDYGGTTTTINLYFTDYSPSNDEWLLNTV